MTTKLTGIDREIADEVRLEFIDSCGYVNDNRTRKLLEPYLETAVIVCKEFNISPACYIKAILSYQSTEGPSGNYMPWQLAPATAKKFVTDYIQSAGKRDLNAEFNTQLRMLGTALGNGIPDRLCLLNPSLDFSPWFRVLMTAVPDKDIIEKYAKEAKNRLDNDFELAKFLNDYEAQGTKLDLSRIPNYKYE